jgi:hypothetical protein
VEREARPQIQERVVTKRDGQTVPVAEVAGVGAERLLRHAHQFVAVDEDELRTVHLVALEERAIPGWRMCPSGQHGDRNGSGVRSQPATVVATEIDRGDIEILDIPLSDQPVTLEALVPGACARNAGGGCVRYRLSLGVGADRSRCGQVVLELCARLRDICKATDELQTVQMPGWRRMTRRRYRRPARRVDHRWK